MFRYVKKQKLFRYILRLFFLFIANIKVFYFNDKSTESCQKILF